MFLDSLQSLDAPIVPDFLLPDDVDKRAARERLARLRTTLAVHDVGAAVFFDAINIRYACGVRNMQINTTRNPGRYVFVPVEGPVVLFEYSGCDHLSEGFDTVDELRRSSTAPSRSSSQPNSNSSVRRSPEPKPPLHGWRARSCPAAPRIRSGPSSVVPSSLAAATTPF